jgi:hypothetical protein
VVTPPYLNSAFSDRDEVRMNGKALPPRPGTRDGPYSNSQGQFGGPLGQQNGYQVYSPKPANVSPTSTRNRENISPQSPNGAVMLEGYRNDIMNGFEGEKARYNPVSIQTLQEGQD